MIPRKPVNTAVLTRKLDQLEKRVNKHKIELDTVIQSYDTHVRHLANFARHDMKNSVQSMDSILNTIDLSELTEDSWESLKASLNDIRATIDRFSELTPYTPNGSFKLNDLLTAVELLARPNLSKNRVTYKFVYPRKSEIDIFQSFQGLLQVLNNLVINSIKALEATEHKEFSIEASIDDMWCEIRVLDNGELIPEQNLDKIFDYGFSTRGGSGIGLFHAKYVCEKINGSIIVDQEANGRFTKQFLFKFPIKAEPVE